MSKPTAVALLRQHFLFRDLQAQTLEHIAALAQRRGVSRGATVFRQGEPGEALYGVVSGRVHIVGSAADGREVLLNMLKAGDTFGEIALLDGGPHTAAARAAAPTELVCVPRASFRALLARDAALSTHLLEMLCRQLRWTTELLEDNVFLPVPARLAKRLLTLDRQHGGAGELEISQDDLARFLGVSRQIVNQTLTSWRGAGWVEIHRGRLTLRERVPLEALVAGPCG